MLPVSAPFHCALMQPAADAMAEALAKVAVKPPVVPLVANVLVEPVTDPAEIVRALIAQVTGTVRWRELVAFMAAQGVTMFYEVGAGKVLTGLVKRIAEGASGVAIGTPDDVAAFKAARGLNHSKSRGSEERHVRSDRQDRARHRRHRRHRRRDCPRVSRAGRHRCDLRHPARGCSSSSPPSSRSASMCCPAISPTRKRSRRWCRSAEEAMGRLDILVANAGINRDNLLVQLSDEAWDEVIAVNLTATFRLARAAVRGHDAPPLRPDHRHHLGRRRHRQCRARATTPPPRPA